MMKVIAINGGPRKNWNTDLLLKKALAGAEAAGCETELIDLYDLNYKGCISCFACKLKNGNSLGRCAVKDELKPVLDQIDQCDGIILGSPIYLADVTGMMRAFIERLVFQYLAYNEKRSQYHGNLKTAFIYTMNIPAAEIEAYGYHHLFQSHEQFFQMIFKHFISLKVTETWQVEDYGKYDMTMFSEADRKKRREEVFPQDCQKAFELGKTLLI